MVKAERYVLEEARASYVRMATTLDSEGKKSDPQEYSPSQLEVLLEDIAESFGTELQPGYVDGVNGSKLVRIAKPVVLTHRLTGEKSVLAMQMTRFSPFVRDVSKIEEAFRANNGLRINSKAGSMERIGDLIKQRDGREWDFFREVTDQYYIPHVNIARWKKELYFAVFNIGNVDSGSIRDVEPFSIHHLASEDRRLPDVYMVFERQPRFVKKGRIEKPEEADSLSIIFPKIRKQHENALASAFRVNTVDSGSSSGILSESRGGFSRLSIDSDARREATMGLIQSYLRKMTTGRVL